MKTSLYYREGSSDKVYQVELVPVNGLFLVNFAFGRRGSTLSLGSKTAAPVDEAKAKDIFAKLVREKKAKGYTEGEEGAPYAHSADAGRVTEYHPQLLNPVPEDDPETLFRDPDWCLQEKFDGRRLLIQKQGAAIHGINRRGLLVGLPSEFVRTIHAIEGDLVLDGECVGETFHAFDLLWRHSLDLAGRPYRERLRQLQTLFAGGPLGPIRLAPTFESELEKRSEAARLKSTRAEGFVLKLLSTPYAPGRPNSGGPALKFKFTASASCLVSAVSNQKRSVSLALWDGAEQRAVGNVTIPPNHAIPRVGDIVETQYLYAFSQSCALYQPVFRGQRDDIPPSDCVLAQLKFKRDESEEE